MMRSRIGWTLLLGVVVMFIGGSEVANSAGMQIPFDAAEWSFEGTQAGEYLGYDLDSAGDLNGDGYDDVVIGAQGHDIGIYSSAGKAWVFYGSSQGLRPDPDVVLEPPELRSTGTFGYVTTTAGDVNGDDYDDLIVSMKHYNGNPVISQQGAVFVYYGSDTGIGTAPDWMARGDGYHQHLGWAAGSAGDVNDDGYDDIIAGGAPDTVGLGGAWVWYGSADGLDPDGSRPVGLPGNADWSASGSSLDYFGTQVGTAGDVNGDGYSDIWVAASFFDSPEENEGKVFVWYGSESGLGPPGTVNNADWAVESNEAGSFTGGEWVVPTVSTAGDVNGDGYDDFLVAAAKYDVVDMEGIAMLFYGSADGLDPDDSRPLGTPANADWYVTGANETDILGYSVALAGDFNDDDYDDFLIGVLNHDVAGSDNKGEVQMWMGSPDGPKPGSLPRHVDCYVEGDQLQERLGSTVAGAGDVNGDGYDDFMGGAIYWDITDPSVLAEVGRVVLFLGEPVVFAEDYESGDLWRYSVVVD